MYKKKTLKLLYIQSNSRKILNIKLPSKKKYHLALINNEKGYFSSEMVGKITQSTCNIFSIFGEEKNKWHTNIDYHSINKNKFITTVDYNNLEDFIFWLTMGMKTKKIILIQIGNKYPLNLIKRHLNEGIYKCKFY